MLIAICNNIASYSTPYLYQTPLELVLLVVHLCSCQHSLLLTLSCSSTPHHACMQPYTAYTYSATTIYALCQSSGHPIFNVLLFQLLTYPAHTISTLSLSLSHSLSELCSKCTARTTELANWTVNWTNWTVQLDSQYQVPPVVFLQLEDSQWCQLAEHSHLLVECYISCYGNPLAFLTLLPGATVCCSEAGICRSGTSSTRQCVN